ncbi:MAG: sorbosone dehydrogenase family protein [Alphaproteobacteria bacterium]|nr:sorbosone dehydrogenase family protein [Alphaproteobacteria bacterium]
MKLGSALAATALLMAGTAWAQQPAPNPALPGPGQPAPHMTNLQLVPHPPVMQVTTPDKIPLDKLKVPAGFKVELWAHGMPGVRMMTRGDKGTIFGGTRIIGRVYAITDKGSQRDHVILAQGLTQPNGLAFRNGALYVTAIHRVLRFDGIEDKLANPGTPVEMTAAFNLPTEVHHNWKFTAFGPDNKLYFQVGAPCNICELDDNKHGQIRRYNPDGSGLEIVAKGVRNTVGFDWDPRSGQLWFTDNGRDWMSEDGPEEELNRVSQIGAHYGFPYCHANGIPDPDFKKPNPCEGVTLPVVTLGAHAAALGMRFYRGNMFPPEYQNSILIARRGSWNKTQKNGYDVVRVTVNPDGTNPKVEPFLTGFLDNQANSFWGRPVDVHVQPDGSVLVSDEQNGAIYRVSYQR